MNCIQPRWLDSASCLHSHMRLCIFASCECFHWGACAFNLLASAPRTSQRRVAGQGTPVSIWAPPVPHTRNGTLALSNTVARTPWITLHFPRCLDRLKRILEFYMLILTVCNFSLRFVLVHHSFQLIVVFAHSSRIRQILHLHQTPRCVFLRHCLTVSSGSNLTWNTPCLQK